MSLPTSTSMKPKSLSERANSAKHPLAKELFALMQEKKSNLSLAADCTSANELLHLAENVGREIVVLKTHIDIISDFTPSLTKDLQQIAKEHKFLLFEDRKFADIGQTVFEQYRGGIYHIAEWADLINAHTFPGPGIVDGLKKGRKNENSALLLLAQMSSAGSVNNEEIVQQAVAIAQNNRDFIIGFIAQQQLTEDPGLITFTPGVRLDSKDDPLGQRYNTPQKAVANGSDIIIVGRGITASSTPSQAARQYREEGWHAFSSE